VSPEASPILAPAICTPTEQTFTQCSGSGSALILVGWTRIQEDKMTHKKENCEKISWFEVLDVLF
jgi:hypothetical protein